MAAALDHAIELGQSASDDRRSGQMNFFDAPAGAGGGAGAAPPAVFPNVEPWSEAQLLAAEKETLGFYISSHPLVRYGRELDSLSQPEGISLATLENYPDGQRVMIGCMVAQVRPTVTKTGKSAGKKMAMLTVEDLTSKADAVVFSEAYERLGGLLVPEAMVFLSGSVDRRRERPNIIVDEIVPIEQAVEQLTGLIVLRLGSMVTAAAAATPGGGATGSPQGNEFLQRLRDVLLKFHGNCQIIVEMTPSLRGDIKAYIRPDRQWFVQPSRRLIDELTGLLGEERFRLKPRPLANGRNGNGTGSGRYVPRPQQPSLLQGQRGVASAAVTRFD